MGQQRSIVRLADGRDLDVLVGGADSTEAFLMINGTPSGVLARPSDVDAVAERGLMYVTYGRPGYADSTRVPGRSVADIAPDVRELAAELGLSRLYVLGWSGGGPHALACAALLPDLVAGAATIGGVAPFDAEGLVWLDGMAPENHEEFGAAVAGPMELEAILHRFAADLSAATGETIAEAFGELVPDVDRAALTGDFADFMAASCHDSVRTGIWGWYDDDLAFIRDWGFDLSSIRVPLTIWQGSEDRMVPFAHGRWLAAHISGARPRLLQGEGHLSLAVSSFGRILDELFGAPARPRGDDEPSR
jgi:pimeloyl-ACP methyl ester carboxylesterase